ncbi:MAG: TetR/AcrR family transcriptional regulator, partial [Clostridia bacterium]|nr:TetR/AcrR family transcriptional regulator [Clostridia bacterium]
VGIATLYRYYNAKPLLVIDIATKKWEEFAEYVNLEQIRRNVKSMNAAENLEFYLDFYIELYKNHKDMLRFNQNFNNYVMHERIPAEQLAPYLRAIGNFAGMFHNVYEKGKRDGTIRTDLPEEKMFASTSHIMLAVAVRYAQGLLYAAKNEGDSEEEYTLLKRMIMREYVI